MLANGRWDLIQRLKVNTCFVSLYEVWTCLYTYSELCIEGILGRQFGVKQNDSVILDFIK